MLYEKQCSAVLCLGIFVEPENATVFLYKFGFIDNYERNFVVCGQAKLMVDPKHFSDPKYFFVGALLFRFY